MTPFVNGTYLPEHSEVFVRVTIPQEFLGCSVGALTSRRGVIAKMEVAGEGDMRVHAWLPSVEYDSLVDEINSSTQRRARIYRDS